MKSDTPKLNDPQVSRLGTKVVQNEKKNVRVTAELTRKRGLDFETFVHAAMATGKAPPMRPKKATRKAKK
jgi:hypothetical protein